MKQVNNIPAVETVVRHDPWLDKVLDGTLRLLARSDWQGRYKTTRSAASAIAQAAGKRGIQATVAIRGDDLYVQGRPGDKAKPATRKAVARKATKKAAPAKAAAKKAPARKAVAKTVPPAPAQAVA